jgi:3-oxoacyl-[acyl-carrier protein] reductase
MRSLAGVVTVVTGASRGVGRATALRFAAEGLTVVAVARDRGRLDALAAEASAAGGRVVPMTGDVREASDARRVVDDTERDLGPIEILVNNAGVERVKPLEAVTDADYAEMVDTNLRGVFNFTRAVVPGMKARRRGQILSVGSIAGIRGFAEDAVYTASKFGVVGFSDALDEELRPFGIRVGCICPGAIATDLSAPWLPPDDPRRPHALQPEDVADALWYAASQRAHVAVGLVVLRPMIEPPHSPMLSVE